MQCFQLASSVPFREQSGASSSEQAAGMPTIDPFPAHGVHRSIHPPGPFELACVGSSAARVQPTRGARTITDQISFNPNNAEGSTTKHTKHTKRIGGGIAVVAHASPVKRGFSFSDGFIQPRPGPLGIPFRVFPVFRGSNEWLRFQIS